jgi:hypothetical protein
MLVACPCGGEKPVMVAGQVNRVLAVGEIIDDISLAGELKSVFQNRPLPI